MHLHRWLRGILPDLLNRINSPKLYCNLLCFSFDLNVHRRESQRRVREYPFNFGGTTRFFLFAPSFLCNILHIPLILLSPSFLRLLPILYPLLLSILPPLLAIFNPLLLPLSLHFFLLLLLLFYFSSLFYGASLSKIFIKGVVTPKSVRLRLKSIANEVIGRTVNES